MPGARIELARGIASRDFKSLASTNSATQAVSKIFNIAKDRCQGDIPLPAYQPGATCGLSQNGRHCDRPYVPLVSRIKPDPTPVVEIL